MELSRVPAMKAQLVAEALDGKKVRAGSAEARWGAEPERVEEAARQFEALLITQLLRAAKGAGTGGWLGGGEDSTASTAMEFAEEQLAAVLAAQGGLGLAKLIAAGLTPRGGGSEKGRQEEVSRQVSGMLVSKLPR